MRHTAKNATTNAAVAVTVACNADNGSMRGGSRQDIQDDTQEKERHTTTLFQGWQRGSNIQQFSTSKHAAYYSWTDCWHTDADYLTTGTCVALEKNSVGVNELIISCSRTVNLCHTNRHHRMTYTKPNVVPKDIGAA